MRATIVMVMTAKTPAHQRQQGHHNEDNDASSTTSDDGDDAILTMAETHLHIDDSSNTIVTRVTIAIVTMAKMPVH